MNSVAVIHTAGLQSRRPQGDAVSVANGRDVKEVRRWAVFAVASLLVAGVFAVIPVVARTPGLMGLAPDPVTAKRFLVVHVNLALVLWFLGCLSAFMRMIPQKPGNIPLFKLAIPLAWVGWTLLVASTFVPGEPVLSNYVPVLNQPLFLAGLSIFGVSVLLNILSPALLPGNEDTAVTGLLPHCARPFVRAAGVLFIVALVTMAGSRVSMPDVYLDGPLYPHYFFESLFWGGGHVLQAANVALMLAAWCLLLSRALPQEPMSRRVASLLAGLLVLPQLAGPVLAGLGSATADYFNGFTRLMQWGIFPTVLIVLAMLAGALWRQRKSLAGGRWFSAAIMGFAASAVLTLVGFICGALISGSNLLIPAHYHASIGAVTAALMAVIAVCFGGAGAAHKGTRLGLLAAVQPALFGAGQVTFVVGFALAGLHGMARKVYGTEQQITSTHQTAGLVVMAVGGAMALAGGVAFAVIAVRGLLRSEQRTVGGMTHES